MESYVSVRMYLSSRTYPEGLTKEAKRNLRQKASSFTIIEGELYHRGRGDKTALVIEDAQRREAIMHEMHAGVVGGCHYGQNATVAKVRFETIDFLLFMILFTIYWYIFIISLLSLLLFIVNQFLLLFIATLAVYYISVIDTYL